jgi:hypothetical protein
MTNQSPDATHCTYWNFRLALAMAHHLRDLLGRIH